MAEEEKETNKSYFAIIPANVRYDKELPMGARLLYGEFTALSNQKGYCYASNSYFAELYDVTPQAISKWINTMANKGYIKLEYGYNKYGIKERRIYIQVTVPPKKDKDEKEEKEETKDSKKVSTQVDEGINIGLRGYQHRIKQNNTDNNKFNNTPNNTPSEDSSLYSESSCEEPNDTDKKETQTDTLITKNKIAEQSDKADRPEEKETGKNSDSQTPPDGPAPWEKPVKKSKPKVPLPFDVESITLKDGREWKPDGYFLQEMIRLHPQVDVKAEFMAMRGWCMSNPTKRKTWGGIKRFVSGWLDRAQDKPKGAGYSGRPQKYKEAFVDGKRDYSDTDW